MSLFDRPSNIADLRGQARVIAEVGRMVASWRGFSLGTAADPYPIEAPRYLPASTGELAISDTTMHLLQHWFRHEPHLLRGGRAFKYWPHQRRLVETFIYLYEVRGIRRTEDLYTLAEVEVLGPQRDPWTKLGGQLATYTVPVKGTDDPELYETERWGNFSYAIPVSAGKYTVLLHFAARHGNWDQFASTSSDGRAVVAHVFNLFCNGKALLQNFNLPREARQGDVVVRRFAGLEPNAQGKLLLSFVPVEGYATVTGIEAIPQ